MPPPSLLVLTNLAAPAEQAARYAGLLGAPLHARLVLLHLYHNPVLDPELVTVTTTQAYRSQAETSVALHQLADRLSAPASVEVSVWSAPEAVDEAVRRHQPLLLAMGLSAEQDTLDHLLHNQALPVLRATHRPLLLVPAAASAEVPPRRVVLAVDAEEFTPNAATRAVAPLLARWGADFTVVHVAPTAEREAFAGQRALGAVRLSGLLPAATAPVLYESKLMPPATGILQALDDMQADLLVLMARPRSFVGRFHRSVTAQVLRGSRVPVLLLPVEAPEQPGWMPPMC
ncbi:universal stress protein [Hymenobacter yonginensis]|uniref:Universal stress protein n=1 Tax=Hymenobacter yonginensis TaxID=748197 RepID=A0ABY7PT37_9BACT|nr:universal stress protein [Hymenobacter yonginensis]WBO86009.1 universal stress protein [Hymenobacter yonginensis]